MAAIQGEIKGKGARFVRFYPSDWRSGCLSMTLEQQGLYVALCAFQWETGKRLSLDDVVAAHALGLNPKNYRKVRDQLLTLGKIAKHEDGYSNTRAEFELRAALSGNAAGRRQEEARQELDPARDVPAEHQDGRDQTPERAACTDPVIPDQSPINPGLIVDQSTIFIEKESQNQRPSKEPIANSQSQGEKARADELARQAYLDGLELKGGKVAKSARAISRTKGELDGSRGITFTDGELTVDAETAERIRKKFPGVDVQAACDKAAPEVARMSYPTRDDAAAVIGKWARIELQNAERAVARGAPSHEAVPFKVTTAMWVKPKPEPAYAG